MPKKKAITVLEPWESKQETDEANSRHTVQVNLGKSAFFLFGKCPRGYLDCLSIGRFVLGSGFEIYAGRLLSIRKHWRIPGEAAANLNNS